MTTICTSQVTDVASLTKWEAIVFDINGKPLAKLTLSTRRIESTYYLKRVATNLLKTTPKASVVRITLTEYDHSDGTRRVVYSEAVYKRTKIGGKVSKWH